MNSKIETIVYNFVKETKKILQDNLVAEYLFGSYAKDEENELSDIDILIIVNKLNTQIRNKINTLSSEYSIEKNIIISPIMKDIKIWEKNVKYNTLFFNEIDKYGIKL